MNSSVFFINSSVSFMNSFEAFSNSSVSFMNSFDFWGIVLNCLGIVLRFLGIVLNCLGIVLRFLGIALGILGIALGSSQRHQINRPRQPLNYTPIFPIYKCFVLAKQGDLRILRGASTGLVIVGAWALHGSQMLTSQGFHGISKKKGKNASASIHFNALTLMMLMLSSPSHQVDLYVLCVCKCDSVWLFPQESNLPVTVVTWSAPSLVPAVLQRAPMVENERSGGVARRGVAAGESFFVQFVPRDVPWRVLHVLPRVSIDVNGIHKHNMA